jgi:hypothetical protein
VKSLTQWHALTAAKWTLFLRCCETLPSVVLGLLGNTTLLNILTAVKLDDWHALLPAAEHQYAFSATKRDQLEYFERCEIE